MLTDKRCGNRLRRRGDWREWNEAGRKVMNHKTSELSRKDVNAGQTL